MNHVTSTPTNERLTIVCSLKIFSGFMPPIIGEALHTSFGGRYTPSPSLTYRASHTEYEVNLPHFRRLPWPTADNCPWLQSFARQATVIQSPICQSSPFCLNSATQSAFAFFRTTYRAQIELVIKKSSRRTSPRIDSWKAIPESILIIRLRLHTY